MALLPNAFDATEHDTTQRGGFEDLPCGIVRMEVEASEIKETARGGAGMKYTAVILEPEEIKGRKLFGYFYLQEPDGSAGFGTDAFASLIRACGVGPKIADTEEVHYFPYTARLGWSPVQYEKTGKTFKLIDGNKVVKNDSRVEVQEYFFPKDDDGNDIDVPAPAIDDPQPRKPVPEAGAIFPDRQAAPANDNAPASRPAAAPAAAKPAGAKPWSKKAA